MEAQLVNIAEIKISYKYGKYFAKNESISNSKDAYTILEPIFSEEMDYRESFHIILMNNSQKILGVSKIADGGTSSVLVDIKLIFQRALKANATTIIIAHNHPSGKLEPSEQDKRITKKIKDACSLLDMVLLDHIILSHLGYYSFADEGIL
jgi:DNA repair protein RadC